MYHVFSPVYLALFFIGPDKQAIFQIAIATVAEPLWDDRQSEKRSKKGGSTTRQWCCWLYNINII
jgi:hypothetical protein